MKKIELPPHIAACIQALEDAGFPTYAVGGCVRDGVLGRTPQDFDLCTQALPDQIRAVFSEFPLVLAGEKHGTVGVVTEHTVVEITTFRTEGGYRDNRHPDWVEFVPDIEKDLARRDFTVNAMAYSPTRGFADPFDGREDLQKGILRAVGDPDARFREDSLRILRGARFAVRFRLTPEEKTWQAMVRLAPLMENLARERVFEELCKLLPLVSDQDLLDYAPILASVIPELAPTLDFDQRSPHHAYDLFTHIAKVTAGVPGDLTLRWAALLHDLGKIDTFTLDETGRGHFYGHAQAGAAKADGILRRLKAPNALRERAVFLIENHMLPLEPEKKAVRRRISRFGLEPLGQLLRLQEADFRAKGTADPAPDFTGIARLMEEIQAEDSCLTLKDLAVNGRDLMVLGLRGPQIGKCLEALLAQVLDEALPNEKAPLLAAAGEHHFHGK